MTRPNNALGIELRQIHISTLFCWCALTLSAQADELPPQLTAEALLDATSHTSVILVDVRGRGEKPALPRLPDITTVRVTWPDGPYSSASNEQHVGFYAMLRTLRRRHPGLPLVLICGAGQRSAEALGHAGEFGLRSGISHVIGGLEGNANDPGLLLQLKLR